MRKKSQGIMSRSNEVEEDWEESRKANTPIKIRARKLKDVPLIEVESLS